MPRCKCGFVLPEGCPSCPPRVIACPGCGTEVLIEPTQDVAMVELWLKIKNKEPLS
jgi:hypothetical protein